MAATGITIAGLTLAEILSDLNQIQISRYVSLAGYALLLYDFVLTLPREVSLIWTAKWSIVKILFFIIRYTVPIVITVNMLQMGGIDTGLTTAVCQRVILILIFWQLTALGLVDVIVSLRIHALWRRRRTVFILMSSLFLLTYTSTLAVTIYIAVNAFGTIIVEPGVYLCGATPPPYIWAVWLPGVVFEFIICVVTGIRTWQHWKEDFLPFREALYSDGLPYFLIALGARFLNLLLWGVATGPLMLLGEQFAFSITGVVCSRLLLNLRGVQTQEDWSEATDVIGSGSISSKHERLPTPTLWIADQGGQSFLEQIYRRAYSPEIRPSFTYMDEFHSEE